MQVDLKLRICSQYSVVCPADLLGRGEIYEKLTILRSASGWLACGENDKV